MQIEIVTCLNGFVIGVGGVAIIAVDKAIALEIVKSWLDDPKKMERTTLQEAQAAGVIKTKNSG